MEDRLAKLTGFRIKYKKVEPSLEVLLNQAGCWTRMGLLCHPDGRVGNKEDSSMVISGRGSYTGETSRFLFERAREHAKIAAKIDKDCHMVKHWFIDHSEERDLPKFKLNLVGKYKDCLTRQLKEAIRI